MGTCGLFTDVAADSFCPFVLEIFYLGVTTGTTPATYDPTSNVNRLQMAAFLSRSVDGVLKRGSRRAALDQFWTTQNPASLGITTLPFGPNLVQSDGADLWMADGGGVSRVRASDGKFLQTWTGAISATGVLAAMGRIFVTGFTLPGQLYQVDPSQPAGAVTTVASELGSLSKGVAFDGSHIWVANFGEFRLDRDSGSIAALDRDYGHGGFLAAERRPLRRGKRLGHGPLCPTLLKLDGSGSILQTVRVGNQPRFPDFRRLEHLGSE